MEGKHKREGKKKVVGRSGIQSRRDPYCKDHRKHTSASFRLILLIACVKLGVVTLLLLLCVINKRSYGMEGLESISELKRKLNKERRGQGTGTNLVQLGRCY